MIRRHRLGQAPRPRHHAVRASRKVEGLRQPARPHQLSARRPAQAHHLAHEPLETERVVGEPCLERLPDLPVQPLLLFRKHVQEHEVRDPLRQGGPGGPAAHARVHVVGPEVSGLELDRGHVKRREPLQQGRQIQARQLRIEVLQGAQDARAGVLGNRLAASEAAEGVAVVPGEHQLVGVGVPRLVGHIVHPQRLAPPVMGRLQEADRGEQQQGDRGQPLSGIDHHARCRGAAAAIEDVQLAQVLLRAIRLLHAAQHQVEATAPGRVGGLVDREAQGALPHQGRDERARVDRHAAPPLGRGVARWTEGTVGWTGGWTVMDTSGDWTRGGPAASSADLASHSSTPPLMGDARGPWPAHKTS